MTRLLFAILSLTIIAQSALAQFAADSGKETRNSVVFQNPAETETQPESDLFQEPQPLPKPQTPPSEPIRPVSYTHLPLPSSCSAPCSPRMVRLSILEVT